MKTLLFTCLAIFSTSCKKEPLKQYFRLIDAISQEVVLSSDCYDYVIR